MRCLGPHAPYAPANIEGLIVESMADLMGHFPRLGRVEWIGVRPKRRGAVLGLPEVHAHMGAGLDGDHYGSAGGSRGLTLIQHEHLAVVGALLGEPPVEPARVRRKLVVAGINLIAL